MIPLQVGCRKAKVADYIYPEGLHLAFLANAEVLQMQSRKENTHVLF